MTLTEDQSRALAAIGDWLSRPGEPYLTVGGYAGTGKTALIAALRAQITADPKRKDWSVAFCAYTGKAASVLRSRLEGEKALRPYDTVGTVHSLIYRPRISSDGEVEGWERAKVLPVQLIVVDEASMLNATIWNDLRAFRVPILLVGDHGQLPPVEGSFSLMNEPQLRLEKIVRQAADNPIIRVAHAVRGGYELPFGSVKGIVRKVRTDAPEAAELFDAAAAQPDTLVLCGTNRTRLQLNARVRGVRGIEEESPTAGDRVICLKNDRQKALYNGMVGTLKKFEPYSDDYALVRVQFEAESKPFTGSAAIAQFGAKTTLKEAPPMPDGERGQLFDFGYALTVHKAQGSEATRVLLFEERTQHMDDEAWRRWLYTAVTRAREELIIFARDDGRAVD